METNIRSTLEVLLNDIAHGRGEAVGLGIEKLDGYVQASRTQLHPQLVHFLVNRSYAKALLFLGGDDKIPVGRCGGRA
jgi:hypothetical protein